MLMEATNANDVVYLTRVLTVFVLSFVLFAIVGKVLGAERKQKWFKKRTKYTLFTNRSVFGEFVHFGYPCCKEGVMVFAGMMGVIFTFGYWYILRP